MALAVHAAQMGYRKAIVGWLMATIVFGTVFLGVKAYEYHHLYTENLIPHPEMFHPDEHLIPAALSAAPRSCSTRSTSPSPASMRCT
jgi:hypothetical protein